MAEQYVLLDQAAEDALHSTRLLNIEERPFKRISKRLLASHGPLWRPSSHLPTPPPEGEDSDAERVAHEQKQAIEREQWREELYLDFAAFESNIIRAQMVLDSNEQERVRYASEKDRILATAQAVQDGNGQLQAELQDARDLLALRKSYDEQAEVITSNRSLKPREEQVANIEKLESEIQVLESEREEYSQTWAERRVQFQRILDEGMMMLRLIRDEKEEAERKEGMDDDDAGEEIEVRGSTGGAGTPAGRTPLHDSHTEDQDGPSSGGVKQASQNDIDMLEANAEESAKVQPENEGDLEEGEEVGSEAGTTNDADRMETT